MHFTTKKEAGKIKSILEKGLKEGRNSSEIQKELKEKGLSYRRSDFLEDLRSLQGKGEIRKMGQALPGPEPQNSDKTRQKPLKKVSEGLNPQSAKPRIYRDREPEIYKDLENTSTSKPSKNSIQSSLSDFSKPKKSKTYSPKARDQEKEKTTKEFLKELGLPHNKKAVSEYIALKNEVKQKKILNDYSKEKGKKTASEYIKRLKKEGLTYRKTDMEKDFREALTVNHSKTPEAKERAKKFFDKVYEPVRQMLKEEGKPYNRKAVNEYIREWKKGSDKISREADAQITEFYLSMYS